MTHVTCYASRMKLAALKSLRRFVRTLSRPRTAGIVSSLLLAFGGAACASESLITQVIVVRHAEKAADGTRDPELSDVGRARADALAKVLRDAHVRAVFATQFKRTQATVDPAARETGVPVVVVDAGDTAGLAERIRKEHAGEVVLVAAHSNTVPEIIKRLGGPVVPELAEDAFDDLFVVTLRASGAAQVLHLSYIGGAPAATTTVIDAP